MPIKKTEYNLPSNQKFKIAAGVLQNLINLRFYRRYLQVNLARNIAPPRLAEGKLDPRIKLCQAQVQVPRYFVDT